jgi:hypothetical protein
MRKTATKRLDVPKNLVRRLQRICLELPLAREEPAWVGVRWKIRGKTFAHVLMVSAGWPPAYAKAIASDGPACILTFRSPLPEVDETAFRRRPFFKPVWWPGIAGMFLDAGTDWSEVEKLVTASYRMLAQQSRFPTTTSS